MNDVLWGVVDWFTGCVTDVLEGLNEDLAGVEASCLFRVVEGCSVGMKACGFIVSLVD